MPGTKETTVVAARLAQKVSDWLEEHGRYRSNLAGAIVVLHALKGKCPLSDEDVFTDGEVRHGRGRALFSLLEAYGIPRFLKDGTTTRGVRASCGQLLNLIEYGRALARLDPDQRTGVVDQLVALVRVRVGERMARRPITVACDPAMSAVAWVDTILQSAREHLSQGRVEQHLVGAKLEERHKTTDVPVHSATAADAQTGRSGDFEIGENAYHVTVAPTLELIAKCRDNLAEGLRPVILVPRQMVEKTKGLASAQGVETRVHVCAMEDFIAQNILEISEEDRASAIDVLRRMVDTYNRRVQQAEVDPALRIELK